MLSSFYLLLLIVYKLTNGSFETPGCHASHENWLPLGVPRVIRYSLKTLYRINLLGGSAWLANEITQLLYAGKNFLQRQRKWENFPDFASRPRAAPRRRENKRARRKVFITRLATFEINFYTAGLFSGDAISPLFEIQKKRGISRRILVTALEWVLSNHTFTPRFLLCGPAGALVTDSCV